MNNFPNVFTLGEMLSFPPKSSLSQSEDKACKEPGTCRTVLSTEKWAKATVSPPQPLHLPWPGLSLPTLGQATQETGQEVSYFCPQHIPSPGEHLDLGISKDDSGFPPSGRWGLLSGSQARHLTPVGSCPLQSHLLPALQLRKGQAPQKPLILF